MAVETALDRATYVADFGVLVTWRATEFLAIFDRPSMVMPGLSEIDLLDRMPALTFPETSLPVGAVEGDVITVLDEFAVTHSFRCKLIRPDGTGFVVVDLKT